MEDHMLATLGFGIACKPVALATLGRLHWHRRRGIQSMVEVREALDTCSHFLQLIRHLQQHRGMCSAYLAGDASFASRLAERRADILADLAALEGSAAREGARSNPCFTRDGFSRYRCKWLALVGNLGEIGIEHSIAQHGQLIAQALDWLANYGEARVELPAGELIATGIVRNFSGRLPSLAEALGQARALGMGAAAGGACRPVTRVRLMFLATRGESLLAQAAGLAESGVRSEVARAAVLDMIKVIRCDILSGQRAGIGADAYYALATSAIDAVYAWIDECVAATAMQIASPRESSYIGPVHRRDRRRPDSAT